MFFSLIFIKNFYIKNFFLSPSVTESILGTEEPKSKNDVRTTKKGDSGCGWLHNSKPANSHCVQNVRKNQCFTKRTDRKVFITIQHLE